MLSEAAVRLFGRGGFRVGLGRGHHAVGQLQVVVAGFIRSRVRRDRLEETDAFHMATVHDQGEAHVVAQRDVFRRDLEAGREGLHGRLVRADQTVRDPQGVVEPRVVGLVAQRRLEQGGGGVVFAPGDIHLAERIARIAVPRLEFDDRLVGGHRLLGLVHALQNFRQLHERDGILRLQSVGTVAEAGGRHQIA